LVTTFGYFLHSSLPSFDLHFFFLWIHLLFWKKKLFLITHDLPFHLYLWFSSLRGTHTLIFIQAHPNNFFWISPNYDNQISTCLANDLYVHTNYAVPLPVTVRKLKAEVCLKIALNVYLLTTWVFVNKVNDAIFTFTLTFTIDDLHMMTKVTWSY